MNTTLLLQILLSFSIGGIVVTLLALLAERVHENLAGIIMMFPTTIVLGFFFLGWTTSPQTVANIIPATITPLGIVIFSSVIYICTASFLEHYITDKKQHIFTTIFLSSLLWLILVMPFALWKFQNVIWGSLGYAFFTIISHLILHQKAPKTTILHHQYSFLQILIRAAFTGSVIATVVILGKVLNPFWGGIFTMYPAVTFASLMIFHYYYSTPQLFHFMKKAPWGGSISLYAYTIAAMLLFPSYGLWLGTLGAYLIALSASLLLIFILKVLKN